MTGMVGGVVKDVDPCEMVKDMDPCEMVAGDVTTPEDSVGVSREGPIDSGDKFTGQESPRGPGDNYT